MARRGTHADACIMFIRSYVPFNGGVYALMLAMVRAHEASNTIEHDNLINGPANTHGHAAKELCTTVRAPRGHIQIATV